MKQIILVFGPICSGKTTYCQKLGYAYPDSKYFKVSDIVRELTQQVVRSELQKTSKLATDIAASLMSKIDDALSKPEYRHVIIDGIRQYEIVRLLVSYYGLENISMVWLEVPIEIREERYKVLSRDRDNISFKDANDNDAKLGLSELERALKTTFEIIHNYE